MPRLQDIERFKLDLAELSHESEVLARWGEKPEEIAPPDAAPRAESDSDEKPSPGRQAPRRGASAPEKTDTGLPPDFATLLDSLPLDHEAESKPPEDRNYGEDADLAALLEPLEEESVAEASIDTIEEPPEAPASDQPDSGADDFSLDMASLLGTGENASEEAESPPDFSLTDFETPAPDFEMPTAGSGLVDETETTGDALSFDLDSLGLPGLSEETSTPKEAEVSGEAPSVEAELGDLSFGEAPSGEAELGDLSFGEAPSGEAELGDLSFGEAPSGEAELGDLSIGEAPSGEAELGDLSFGEAPSVEAELGDLSFGEAPSGEAELGDLSFGEAPSGETELGDLSFGEAPSGEAELGDLSFGEAPSVEAELGDLSFGEAPSVEAELGALSLGEASGEEAEPSEAVPAEEIPATIEDLDFGLDDFGTETAGSPSEPKTGDTEFSIPDFGDGGSGEKPSEQGLEAKEPEVDAFESFTFEAEGPGGFDSVGAGIGAGAGSGDEFDIAPGAPLGLDLDKEIAGLGEAVPEADTFSLDKEWGGGFDDLGAIGSAAKKAPSRPTAVSSRKTAAVEKVRPVALSDSQVDKLQDALLSFPLNLRVVVEDVLANEKGSEAQLSKLVWAMVEGFSAEDVAVLAGKIVKRRIEIPKGYEKRTGAAHEARKGTIGYAFIHTVLPILRVALIVAALGGMMGYLGWRYVYQPLAADALYRSGYQRIAESRYTEAEAAFARATNIREFIHWYYDYAKAYVAKRQYILAEKKYQSLLERHPLETAGALAWASLEKDQLKFESAIEILKKRILNRDYYNKEALLLQGDVYLAWGEEDPKWYDEARRTFAGLIQKYGPGEAFLERMLLYFIRTDNLKEVLLLKKQFLAATKSTFSASTLAELGGYLFGKGNLEDVHRILTRAAALDPALPETHYYLAQYFRRSNSPPEERKALDNAVKTFAAQGGLTGKRTGMYIESLIRRGRFRLGAKEWLGAEQDFSVAVSLYESALELRRVKKSLRFGEAYAGLGEVAYRQRDDLDTALRLFEKAESAGFDNADLRYKRGYILYRKARFGEALEQFYKAGLGGEESPHLLYAFGSAFYAREDFFAAEANFRRLADAMNHELSRIDAPRPQESATEGEIVELLMKSQNNLGAALFHVAARVGDARLRSKAIAAFAEAARLFDSLSRDQVSLKRSEAKNLGYLNMDFVLHPRRDIDIAIYPELERDIVFPRVE